MKKMLLALAAVMTMSANVMAQENNQEQVQQKEQRQRPDQTEMVKRRTQQMAERYKLNETQAAQLLELNTRFAGKMGPTMGGQRERGQRGDRQASRPQQRERRQAPADSTVRQQKPQDKENANDRREEMRKNREAYEKELQQIMTEEQYKTYKQDTERRGRQIQGDRRGGRGGDRRGQRATND